MSALFNKERNTRKLYAWLQFFSGRRTTHGSIRDPWQLNITLRNCVLVSRIFKPRSKSHGRLVLISLIPHGTYTLSLSTL